MTFSGLCLKYSNLCFGLFTIYQKFPEISVGNFRLGGMIRVVYHFYSKIPDCCTVLDWIPVGIAVRAKRPETRPKQVKRVNGTRISIRNVPTGKTGLSFQNFRSSREFSSGTNQKIVFHLHPKRNFREFLVNGKQPW